MRLIYDNCHNHLSFLYKNKLLLMICVNISPIEHVVWWRPHSSRLSCKWHPWQKVSAEYSWYIDVQYITDWMISLIILLARKIVEKQLSLTMQFLGTHLCSCLPLCSLSASIHIYMVCNMNILLIWDIWVNVYSFKY